MKRIGITLGVLGCVLSAGALANAGSLLEIRGGVGLTASDPDDFNDAVGPALEAGDFDNYNLDLYFNIPVLPFGVGIRNEWLSQDQSGNGQSWEIDATNLSLFADIRFINRTVFAGVIGGIGYPSGTYKDSTQAKVDLDSSNATAFIGGELGGKLGFLILMVEAGYQSIPLKTETGDTSVDLSGYYGKAMVGIGLF